MCIHIHIGMHLHIHLAYISHRPRIALTSPSHRPLASPSHRPRIALASPYNCICIHKYVQSQEAFKKAFGGQGLFKPKQHFAAHASVNILKFGPMREYWCFSYEGMHQRVKRISKNSNWRNVAKRIMRFWCNQFMCMMGSPVAHRDALNNLA